MTSPVRVVLDSNVVVSALVFSAGRMALLRAAWQDGRCVPLLSRATAGELIRVLKYPKFRLTDAAQQELLADLLPFGEVVRMPARPPVIPACHDPLDAAFIQLAIVGKATHLVSGDKDLLVMAAASLPFRILTPSAFLDAIGPR